MDRKKGKVRHMVAGLVVDTSQIDLTPSNMVYYWTLRKGEGIYIGMVLVLIQIGTMIIIVIILLKRSDREYFLDEFKKAKPHIFDGEMKNS